ncbi:hypothetical protein E3Q24_03779 [Wallemia mellicola]|uniref:DnaJ-domain-containing protein n=1 Tax=Wallemia mellicola TaxID=1708541 RepID=A0AB74KAX0_9BASI|nr:hypothetical protein E3Q24_03779 [Wallemia mellicola]TIC59783.1 DnaJ-domain-containing protein [Wallemia mellicola]
MGNRQSTSTLSSEDDDSKDFYQLLCISEDASQDDIKKSFRKLALIHHPDKNPGNVEAANQKFSKLQEAYETLSDEQERAWYDQNKNAAEEAGEEDDAAAFEEMLNGQGARKTRLTKDPGITTRQLIRFFNPKLWNGYDSSSKGFYTIMGALYARLAEEEATAAPYDFEEDNGPCPAYPGFGDENTPFESTPRDFYALFGGFSSRKCFAWRDLWDLRDAQDRRVRRIMEKENKAARDEARKEYNETIRQLTFFIRKRDPRYRNYAKKQAQYASPEAAQQRRSEANEVRKKERNAAAATFVEQSWQQVSSYDMAVEEAEELEEMDKLHCFACDKNFNSEKAFENHEKSKKHNQMVKILRKHLEKEERELIKNGGGQRLNESSLQEHDYVQDAASSMCETPGESTPTLSTTVEAKVDNLIHETEIEHDIERQLDLNQVANNESESHTETETTHTSDLGSVDYEEKKINEEIDEQIVSQLDNLKVDGVEVENNRDPSPVPVKKPLYIPDEKPQRTKKEKRRAREAAKRALENAVPITLYCNVCHEPFSSRTKLFNHIRDTGHALAGPDDHKYKRNKKKGKRNTKNTKQP